MSAVVEPFPLGPALLFCPGDRPDRFAKAAARADAVILDLEDAVGPAHKQSARDAVVDALGTAGSSSAGAAGAGGSAAIDAAAAGATGAGAALDPARTIVRVNAPGTEDVAADVAALAGTEVRWVMLPKAEHSEDVDRLVADLPAAGVVVLCETARGVLAAADLAAHPAVVALMWGGEDLVASLGGASSRRPDGGYRDVVRHARSAVLLAARAHGRAAVDAIHADLADSAGLRAEAEDAAASGFTATACIHPAQVPVIRSAYSPTEEEADWSSRVLAAAAAAGGGVFELDGRMVDEPILRHARRLASRSTTEETP
ncbi:CoA ester lyase [Georgenia sp. H159]|uniref:HpcH/HpaI aldolase/citrate lyase family protein n=1 Tax=Georgenia sp. H159 TaxID=3076115 RepID=UPI002D78D577|nr:CoA ester lyase [Georgenia sp. H159]